MALGELIDKVHSLNEAGESMHDISKHREVLSILSNEVLQTYNNEQLYANRARAFWGTDEFIKAIQDCDKAISINPKISHAHLIKAFALIDLQKYDDAINEATIAIELSPEYSIAYCARGRGWKEKNNLVKALKDYNKALEIDPNNETAYNSRGVVWEIQKQWDKALEDYSYAAKLDPNEDVFYRNLGDVYTEKSLYTLAVDSYKKALELNPFNTYAQYGIDQIKALLGEPVIESNENQSDVPLYLFIRILNEANIDEQNKKKILKICSEIKLDAIDKIRKHAAENIEKYLPDGKVVHYTKLNIADIFVSDPDSHLRFYNAVYMNDPQEGLILMDCINQKIRRCFENASSLQEEENIYIGSFLPANKHEDELVMWRTYGKDAKQNDAAGCSVIIDATFFDKFNEKDGYINPGMGSSDADVESLATPQCLYKVLYYDQRGDDGKKIKGENSDKIEEDLGKLNQLLLKLIELKKGQGKTRYNNAIDKIVYHTLSELRYFFKSADYEFENEVRVIQFASKKSKLLEIDNTTIPKKVYVDSNNPVQPFIRSIILGPKVPNPKQWLYFEIAMKKNGHDISVKRSERQYQ